MYFLLLLRSFTKFYQSFSQTIVLNNVRFAKQYIHNLVMQDYLRKELAVVGIFG